MQHTDCNLQFGRRLSGLEPVHAGGDGFPFVSHDNKGVNMKKLTYLFAVVFAVLLSACAPTQTSRGTGQFIDDASLTARVKTQIAQTQGLGEAAKINVDTYRGVVSLAGFVDNEQQVRAAVQAANKVPGVSKVVSNLQIKSKDTSSGR
jgi:osmotically-inducible protein OsmY